MKRAREADSRDVELEQQPSPEQPAKIVDLDPTSSPEEAVAAMACLLHPGRVDFASYDAYETHYNQEHLNRCLECRRNFPSPYYLGLHTDEWHDPFVAVRRDKGEHTFACFVEGCDRKCGSADKRRRHLIDKHSFPRNFFFGITQYGIDSRQSLLDDGRRRHRRRSSASKTHRRAGSGEVKPEVEAVKAAEQTELARPAQPAQTEKQPDTDMKETEKDAPDGRPAERPDVDMNDLAGAMSAMTFVPRSVKFGRGGKIGVARRS